MTFLTAPKHRRLLLVMDRRELLAFLVGANGDVGAQFSANINADPLAWEPKPLPRDLQIITVFADQDHATVSLLCESAEFPERDYNDPLYGYRVHVKGVEVRVADPEPASVEA